MKAGNDTLRSGLLGRVGTRLLGGESTGLLNWMGAGLISGVGTGLSQLLTNNFCRQRVRLPNRQRVNSQAGIELYSLAGWGKDSSAVRELDSQVRIALNSSSV